MNTETALACTHGASIGDDCAWCGRVGGDGPDQIEAGQVWALRGPPYTPLIVVAVEEGRISYSVRQTVQSMDPTNFRDEFWFRGGTLP